MHMQVKIDTKEKYHLFCVLDTSVTAIMTEELQLRLLTYLQNPVKNIVLKCKDIISIDDAAAETLIYLQQKFYEHQASFVVCALQPKVEEELDKTGLLELMNVVPTESEAGDIVLMEEIERELM